MKKTNAQFHYNEQRFPSCFSNISFEVHFLASWPMSEMSIKKQDKTKSPEFLVGLLSQNFAIDFPLEGMRSHGSFLR